MYFEQDGWYPLHDPPHKHILATIGINVLDMIHTYQMEYVPYNVIMFLSRCEQEINLNRKLAKELVDKWSRPIFNKSTRFEDMQNSEDDRVPYRRPSVKKPANKAAGMASRDGDLDLDLSQPRCYEPTE
ncbi:protein IWS1 [Trifolium pratense]|uniref:Protein IWS1 n=1 Tax=Trifolium pratense TaxID=57577 RepID=A0A2K3NVY2_TRIPR|nr:protein IWS1 [Trifolium pratense]